MSYELLFQTIYHLNEYIDQLKHNTAPSLPPGFSYQRFETPSSQTTEHNRRVATNIADICKAMSYEMNRFESEVVRGCDILRRKVEVLGAVNE